MALKEIKFIGPRSKFITWFLKEVKGTDPEVLAKLIWNFGSEEWANGYALGIRNLPKQDRDEYGP